MKASYSYSRDLDDSQQSRKQMTYPLSPPAEEAVLLQGHSKKLCSRAEMSMNSDKKRGQVSPDKYFQQTPLGENGDLERIVTDGDSIEVSCQYSNQFLSKILRSHKTNYSFEPVCRTSFFTPLFLHVARHFRFKYFHYH